MRCTMLKGKLHKARVTHSELEYEGSCAIDTELLKAVGIREYEMLHIYNIANGERFTTYAIAAEPGSGVISINGAAARKASPGDKIIICAYLAMTEEEADKHQPNMIYLNERNEIVRTSNNIPMQVA